MATNLDEIELAEDAELLSEEPEGAGDELNSSKLIGHIPRKFMTKKMREEIQEYLANELSMAEGERYGFMAKIARWEIAYEAPLPLSPKHFPIFNASNLTTPVIKEAVNTLAAQLVQVTDTARPRYVFKDLAPEWEPFTDPVEQFLDLASDRDMDLSEAHADWVIECAKMGTGIMEVPWEIDERRIYKYDESGMRAYPSTITLRDGPTPRHIPIQKFWIRFHERSIQDARWVAKELEFNEVELRRKQDAGKFHSIDALIKWYWPDSDLRERQQEEIEKTRPMIQNIRVFEVWLSWDVDGDDTFEETKLYFHRESGLLIGEFFNPYWHGKRPFVKIGYFPRPGRFYDEGLCEMLEQLQVAISNTGNRRADNAAWANLKMLLKRRTVRNLMPGDPLYMGKIIEVNDPNSDVRELNMAEVYPSTINEERMLQSRVERVAGTNEGIAGAAMPVTRTTASAQIALLQEQAKRIDLTVRNIRRGQSEIGRLKMALYSQYGTAGKPIAWLGSKKGMLVEALFRLPRRVSEMGMSLWAQAPTSMQNKQVQRENKIQLFNLLLQLYKEIFPLAQQFAPESAALVAAGAIKGAQKYASHIMEAFEETDPEGVLAGLAVLERLLPSMEDLGGLEDIERRVEAASVLDSVSRLERLAQETEASFETSRALSDPSGNRKRFSAPEGLSSGNGVNGLVGGAPPRG